MIEPLYWDMKESLHNIRNMRNIKYDVSSFQMISDIFVSLRRQEEQRAMMTSGVRGDNIMRKMRPSTVATRFNESLLDLITTMTKWVQQLFLIISVKVGIFITTKYNYRGVILFKLIGKQIFIGRYICM